MYYLLKIIISFVLAECNKSEVVVYKRRFEVSKLGDQSFLFLQKKVVKCLTLN